jgi:hypothetical protein
MSNLPPPPDRDHPTFYRAPYRAYVRAQNSTEYPHVHLLGPLEWDCANRPDFAVDPICKREIYAQAVGRMKREE